MLDDFGMALFNQRHAHYFMRYAVEASVPHEQSANVLAEAELLEDWNAAAIDEAAHDCDETNGRGSRVRHLHRPSPAGAQGSVATGGCAQDRHPGDPEAVRISEGGSCLTRLQLRHNSGKASDRQDVEADDWDSTVHDVG